MPSPVSCPTASYVRVPERDTTPTFPALWMRPGMIPILHLPGEMIPGQFGPISRARRVCRNSQARTMSSTGMPSVMQMISSTSASAASMIASAANGGGTKIIEVSAPVLSTASCTVLNTGQPSCVAPPLPGVTPPTIFVPYSAQALAWNVPSRPVMPCTMTFVDLSTRMLMSFCRLTRCRDHLFCRVFHRLSNDEVQSRLLQNLSSLLNVRAFEAQHDWKLNLGLRRGFDNSARQRVHTQNAAKNVDQHCLHVLIAQ